MALVESGGRAPGSVGNRNKRLGPLIVMMADPLGPAVVLAAPAVRTGKVAPVSMFSRVTLLVPAMNTARGPTWGGLPALLSW